MKREEITDEFFVRFPDMMRVRTLVKLSLERYISWLCLCWGHTEELLNYYSMSLFGANAEIPSSEIIQWIVQLVGPQYSFCANIQPTLRTGGRGWGNDCR